MQRKKRRLKVKNIKKKIIKQQKQFREKKDSIVELKKEEKKVKKICKLESFYKLSLLLLKRLLT
jgi:hypothetical protein